MFALAEEKGVNLYVAQVLQFTREVEVLRKLVREGTYGRPLDAVFQRLSARPEWAQGGWLFDKSKSGLVPFDLHIHDLDVIVSLFGVPDQAECRPCGGPAMDSPELYLGVPLRRGQRHGRGGLAQRLHPLHRRLAGVF